MRAFGPIATAFGAALVAAPSFAEAPTLRFPVACTLGETCFIQNYVDTDPSAQAADFTCGALTYDGHKGTDIALPTELEAGAQITVLAAAAGTVTALRDGVPDTWGQAPAFPEGQECGNGLVIDHGDGWETQYCHLKNGSLTVARGQEVQAGTPLGEIGKSGQTEFPHLHLSLRHHGEVIDPFEPEPDATCGADPDNHLWQAPIAYTPGGLLGAGFAAGVPEFEAIKRGGAHAQVVSAQQGALVFWVHLFGTRAVDAMRLTITGPDGVFYDGTTDFDRSQARAMRAGGRKLHAGNTLPGPYTGTAILLRQGKEIDRITVPTTLRD